MSDNIINYISCYTFLDFVILCPARDERVLKRICLTLSDKLPIMPFFSLHPAVTYLFQSFTEGELKQIVSALVDQKIRQDGLEEADEDRGGGLWSSEDRMGRRTKRARKDQRPCALREVHRTVSELGLGYESDEIVVFRYCSGKCTARRRHYDMVLEHMQRAGQLDEGSSSREKRGKSRRDKARYSPCCRPTRYEKDMSFLGNNNIFYTIPDVSARECGCV